MLITATGSLAISDIFPLVVTLLGDCGQLRGDSSDNVGR